MPQALRLVAVYALSLCMLAAVGAESVAASNDNNGTNAKKAHAGDTRSAYEREYLTNYAELVKRHGVHTAGCNLVTNKYENRCKGKTTKSRVVKSNQVLERMLYVPPPPAPVANPPQSSPAGSAEVSTGGAANGTLETIAQCESGGNPATNTGNGFYGKYQFDLQTWQSVGGSGLPSSASEAEQDARAAALYAQRGAAPWPVCGQ